MTAKVFTCSLDNAKQSFYRAFNSLFGKIGHIASEDVIVQLLKTKCLPVLLYCLEACPLKKSQLNAVDFALNCAFRKIVLCNMFKDVAMKELLAIENNASY